MRRYKKNFTSFKDVLFKSSPRLGLSKGLSKYSLWDNWSKIIPKTVLKHTKPVRWQGDILIIGTTTSAWTQELSFLKPELMNRIKNHDPRLKIKDIWFETGHSFDIKKNTKPVDLIRKPITQEILSKINEWTSDIKDSELKNAIKNALCSVLSRKK